MSRIFSEPKTPSAVGSLTPAGRAACRVNLGQRPNAIGRHVDPARDLLLIEQPRPERLLDAGRHAGSGFARTDDGDAANSRVQRQGLLADDEAVALHPQVLAHQPVAADGSERPRARWPGHRRGGPRMVSVEGIANSVAETRNLAERVRGS